VKNRTAALIAAPVLAATMLVSAPGAVAATSANTKPVGPVAQLIADGTITPQQLVAARVAIAKEAEAARDAKRTAVLTPLVTAGTITQADLDAIVQADGRVGLRQLIARRAITHPQAAAVRAALRGREVIDRASVIDAAMADLVSAGTLTSSQSAALDAALTARRAAHSG